MLNWLRWQTSPLLGTEHAVSMSSALVMPPAARGKVRTLTGIGIAVEAVQA